MDDFYQSNDFLDEAPWRRQHLAEDANHRFMVQRIEDETRAAAPPGSSDGFLPDKYRMEAVNQPRLALESLKPGQDVPRLLLVPNAKVAGGEIFGFPLSLNERKSEQLGIVKESAVLDAEDYALIEAGWDTFGPSSPNPDRTVRNLAALAVAALAFWWIASLDSEALPWDPVSTPDWRSAAACAAMALIGTFLAVDILWVDRRATARLNLTVARCRTVVHKHEDHVKILTSEIEKQRRAEYEVRAATAKRAVGEKARSTWPAGSPRAREQGLSGRCDRCGRPTEDGTRWAFEDDELLLGPQCGEVLSRVLQACP